MTVSTECNQVINNIIWSTRRVTIAINMMRNQFAHTATKLTGEMITLKRLVARAVYPLVKHLCPPFLATLFTSCASALIQARRGWSLAAFGAKPSSNPLIDHMVFAIRKIVRAFFIRTFLADGPPSNWHSIPAMIAKSLFHQPLAPAGHSFAIQLSICWASVIHRINVLLSMRLYTKMSGVSI